MASKFFQKHQAEEANAKCCDSVGSKAEWASVSHGIYISIEAAGVHRSLGVKRSFVLSTSLDSWKPEHLKMMQLGGNQRFHDFMSQHVPKDMPLRQKYLTRAAEWYRENLRAEAEGLEPPAPLKPGTGHLLLENATSQEELLNKIFVPNANASVHATPQRNLTASRSLSSLPARSASGDLVGRLTKKLKALHEVKNTKDKTPAKVWPGSEGRCVAQRLQLLSTGKMDGFGSDAACAASCA